MQNFAAIDFETANYYPSSICSIGVVIVRDGRVVETIYRLVRPEPDWYSFWNTNIHGLTAEHTLNEQIFPFVWTEIVQKIGDLPLVAHNSAFEKRCLQAVFRVYQMDFPDYEFFCTCRASRKIFGKILPNHQLHTVSEHCGYVLKNHHNAMADAEACAAIALKIL
jgi:DNA polymerase-3 subunit epsilon